MRRFIWHAEVGGDRAFRALAILGVVDELMDQSLTIFGHALDERAGKKTRGFAERERHFHAAAGGHFAAETIVLFVGEVRVEGVAIGGDHVFILPAKPGQESSLNGESPASAPLSIINGAGRHKRRLRTELLWRARHPTNPLVKYSTSQERPPRPRDCRFGLDLTSGLPVNRPGCW